MKINDILKEDPQQPDMFPDTFADKSTTVGKEVPVDSKGNTETIQLPNVNSRGGMISSVKQVVENFWQWFGHSEAVDGKGRPLVFFHGTNADFDEFKTQIKSNNNYGLLGDVATTRHAIFVTPNLSFASGYSNNRGDEGANIISVYVKAENPIDLRHGLSEEDEINLERANPDFSARFIHNIQHTWELFDDDMGDNFVAACKKAGYDSARIFEYDEEADDNADVWVLFSGKQLKSVFNKGTYSNGTKIAEATGLMFKGYPCTKDCGGHKAGWKYAEQRRMDANNPNDVQKIASGLGGPHNSFHEGMKSYIEGR